MPPITPGLIRKLIGEAFSPAARQLLDDPAGFIKQVLVNVVLAGVAAFTFSTVDLIARAFDAAIVPFGASGEILVGSTSTAATIIVTTIQTLTTDVAGVVAGQLGIGAFPVTVGLYTLYAALVIRSLPPLIAGILTAASDGLGAVPVVGSLLDAGATFVQEFVQRYIGGDG